MRKLKSGVEKLKQANVKYFCIMIVISLNYTVERVTVLFSIYTEMGSFYRFNLYVDDGMMKLGNLFFKELNGHDP